MFQPDPRLVRHMDSTGHFGRKNFQHGPQIRTLRMLLIIMVGALWLEATGQMSDDV